jgi:hypothetical protein
VNQIPRGKLFAGAVRAGSGLPRDTIDAATSPEYAGRPVRRAWRNAQAAADAGRRGPGDRKTGLERGTTAPSPTWASAERDQASTPPRTAAFQQRVTHWARTSGDCAARPRDRHVRGRGQCGAGAQTPGTGGPRPSRPRPCRDTRRPCWPTSRYCPLGHVSPFRAGARANWDGGRSDGAARRHAGTGAVSTRALVASRWGSVATTGDCA